MLVPEADALGVAGAWAGFGTAFGTAEIAFAAFGVEDFCSSSVSPYVPAVDLGVAGGADGAGVCVHSTKSVFRNSVCCTMSFSAHQDLASAINAV